ncbi:hypothetical protein BS47DRAFT_1336781 [Hydnum rufescens UP504]|uniref:SCP2 domain-containing protein n=1 Tax=Hydnum rufescens UP504 TaxID=1448309 RepID=A0A9P6B8G5_9AGAM|nr:hypothetical protein BS47DRAFT_1336781 [Hydnum rufescens UP504]
MSDIVEPGFKMSKSIRGNERARQEQMKKVNGIFELRAKSADGKEGIWTIDLKTEGKVLKGTTGAKPDVVLSASENFVNIASGALNGQKAFMTGKLKAKGNIMLATKLTTVLSAAKTKAKL